MQGQSERAVNSLAKARAELGVTQEVLAVMLGVSRKYISMIETGAKPMSKKLSKKLALIMDGGGSRRCCGCRCCGCRCCGCRCKELERKLKKLGITPGGRN